MPCLGRLLGGAAVASVLAIGATAILPAASPASLWSASAQGPAQQVSLEVFESELAPYGAWIDHPRYGRVWTPTNMPADWRPYSTGRWEWTDEDGWYWQADETWGWIPFHYGRWFLDNQFGWLWVPGLVWGPAWVSWRETDDGYLGWAPLPPDDVDFAAGPPAPVPGPTATAPPPPPPQVADGVYDNPAYWTFVPEAEFGAPNIYQVRVPPAQVQIYLPRTRVRYRSDVRILGDVPRGFNRGFDRAYIERVSRGRPIVIRREPPRFLEAEIIRRRGPNAPELRVFRDNRTREFDRVRQRNVQIRNQQDQIQNQRRRIDNQQQRIQDQRQQNRQDPDQNRRQNDQQRQNQPQDRNQNRQEQPQQNRQQEQRQQERQQEQRRQEQQQNRQQEQRQQERPQEQRRQEQQQNRQQEQRRQEQQGGQRQNRQQEQGQQQRQNRGCHEGQANC